MTLNILVWLLYSLCMPTYSYQAHIRKRDSSKGGISGAHISTRCHLSKCGHRRIHSKIQCVHSDPRRCEMRLLAVAILHGMVDQRQLRESSCSTPPLSSGKSHSPCKPHSEDAIEVSSYSFNKLWVRGWPNFLRHFILRTRPQCNQYPSGPVTSSRPSITGKLLLSSVRLINSGFVECLPNSCLPSRLTRTVDCHSFCQTA